MNVNGVFCLGAAAGAVLGFSATFRARKALTTLAGVVTGALAVAAALGSLALCAVSLGQWAASRGIVAGSIIGTLFGGAAGYLLGVLGIAFFGFLFRPDRGVVETLRASAGRGAIVVAVIGTFFGGISGAVLGALEDIGLL